MYKKILVTLENTATDRAIIDHVKRLAKAIQSRVTLLHVATGVPAQIHGADAVGQEVEQDRAYLAEIQAEFEAAGIGTQSVLGFGVPAKEIVRWVDETGCDLVAMGTHGHGVIADAILGTTANRVQHSTSVPVLLLRAK